MLVGAHVSVARGYVEALDYARSVGCECLQLFAKSPRQWRGPVTDRTKAEAFIEERVARGFGPVFTHTAYLINLSTSNDELREKSVAALADELTRAALLGADAVVTHVGNDPSGDREAAGVRAGESVARAFELAGDAADGVRLLLENTAGAGSTFGGSLEEIAHVMDVADLPADALGMCFDTCHGFAFGFGLDTEEGWDMVIRSLRDVVGIDRLGLVHANDCLFERGSRRDRHAWIGDGLIGTRGFEAMMCRPELDGVCTVTEMPGEIPEKDAVNVERLVLMREKCARTQ